jgi:hypothetical protein
MVQRSSVSDFNHLWSGTFGASGEHTRLKRRSEAMEVETLETTSTEEVLQLLLGRTAFAVQGAQALLALRDALQRGVAEAGIHVEFEPDTVPTTIDWFGLTAAGAAAGALGAGALGLLIGALFGRPMVGLAVGAAAGGIAGGAAGAKAVRRGWRICVTWLPTGGTHALLQPCE